MILFADEGELVEKYRRLTDEGRARISSQIECELRIDAEAVAKRNEKQRRGIHEAKKAGIHFGLPKKNYPANRDTVYTQWKAQDITADEAAVKLSISKSTLYRMAKRSNKDADV